MLPIVEKTRFAQAVRFEERDKIIEAPLFDETREFGLSRNGLERRFIGNADAMAEKVHSLFPRGVPTNQHAIRTYPKKRFALTIYGEGQQETFIPEKRTIGGNQAVWAIPLTQVTAFSRATGFRENDERIETAFDESKEFSLSGKSLEKQFIGGERSLAAKIYSLFPAGVPTEPVAIRAYPSHTFTLTIEVDGKSTTFIPNKRIASGLGIWALPYAEKTCFVKALGLHERDKVLEVPTFDQSKEFALSSKGLQRQFIGSSDGLAAKIHPLFPAGIPTEPIAIRAYAANSFILTVEVDGKNITFTAEKRNTGGGKATWVLPLTEKERFAKAARLQEKDKVANMPNFNETKEFALSGRGLEQCFVGTVQSLLAKVYPLFPLGIPTDPYAIRVYPQNTFTFTVEVDGEKITFTPAKRSVDRRIAIWALDLADRDRFAKAAGLVLRGIEPELLGDGEIVVSHRSMRFHFVDNPKVSRSVILDALSDEEEKTAAEPESEGA